MNQIQLTSFNIWGQKINEGVIFFDPVKETILRATGEEMKVIKCNEFTYKIQKTQIKAIGGMAGLLEFLTEINTPDSPFNPSCTELFIGLFSNSNKKGEIGFAETITQINH